MAHPKLRAHRTDLDNLISNLRGEIGEIIFAWILLRLHLAATREASSGDIAKDMRDPKAAILNALTDKLADEIVGRLSELGERKIGRLNFYFASEKLDALRAEVDAFEKYTKAQRFHEKRNYDIAHKELPEQWTDHKLIHIPYRRILRGVAMALRLMKKIDRVALGPSAPYLWREIRKRRYPPSYPERVRYMILRDFNLSPEDRVRIVLEEEAEGMDVWEWVETKVQEQPARIRACKRWGVLHLGDRLLPLDAYPLIQLHNLTLVPKETAAPPDGSSTDGTADQ